MKSKSTEKTVFICNCFSSEHQIIFTYNYGEDETDYDDLDFEVYLNPTLEFWKRIVAAVKYIFGYRSKYGNWDCFTVNYDDCDKLIEYLQKLKSNYATIHSKIEKDTLKHY